MREEMDDRRIKQIVQEVEREKWEQTKRVYAIAVIVSLIIVAVVFAYFYFIPFGMPKVGY